ncbi:MAG: hypothetical protein Q9225_007230 [Loekoesia sp. 1 TL-2023]
MAVGKSANPKNMSNPKSKPRNRESSSSSIAAPKPRAPPPLQKGPVDEEGTPDIYGLLFTLLKKEGSLRRRIEERASLDWRAEKPLVDTFASTVPNQPSFLPRQGEIVLYLRPLLDPLQLRQDPQSLHFKIYDPRTSSYSSSPPQWLAGVVTQVPTSPPTVSSLHPPQTSSTTSSSPNSSVAANIPSETSLNTSGYRISPLPSPNSSNKLLSKQHTYTPLHLIRPLSLHTHILAGIPPSNFDESILNALTDSATISLIDRHTFSGNWPHAKIHSRGIFIDAEAYWIGDTVLLLPETPSSSSVSEIMHISDIVTIFHSLQSSPESGNVTGENCKRISIEVHGAHARYHAHLSQSNMNISHPRCADTGNGSTSISRAIYGRRRSRAFFHGYMSGTLWLRGCHIPLTPPPGYWTSAVKG